MSECEFVVKDSVCVYVSVCMYVRMIVNEIWSRQERIASFISTYLLRDKIGYT